MFFFEVSYENNISINRKNIGIYLLHSPAKNATLHFLYFSYFKSYNIFIFEPKKSNIMNIYSLIYVYIKNNFYEKFIKISQKNKRMIYVAIFKIN